MKIVSPLQHCLARWVCAMICLSPSLAMAHPGHYHPDETDEFDFFRSTILHSHGALDYVLIGVAAFSLAVAILKTGTSVRLGACALAVGALLVRAII